MTESGRPLPHAPGDDAIDRAVRELMTVDAEPGFRGRVLTQIARPRPRRSGAWRVGLAAAALGATISTFVFLPSPFSSPTPVPAPGVVTGTVDARSRTTSAGFPELPVPTAVPAEQPAARQTRPRGDSKASNATQVVPAGTLVATIAEEESAAPAGSLAELAPIAIEPIRPAPIGSPPITIAPLAPISGLQIAPLPPLVEKD